MRPGDIVKRQDGRGALMAVESVSPVLISLILNAEDVIVRCSWFDGQNKLRKLNFLESQLELIPPESLKRDVPHK